MIPDGEPEKDARVAVVADALEWSRAGGRGVPETEAMYCERLAIAALTALDAHLASPEVHSRRVEAGARARTNSEFGNGGWGCINDYERESESLHMAAALAASDSVTRGER